MRIIITASLIFLFWFILSGQAEVLMLSLGLLSTLLSIFLSKRMEKMDHESYHFHLTVRLFSYWLFLAKEIIVANIDVIKRILKPTLSISPQVITLPASKKTELSKVIYANSITLTPGTVTLSLSDNELKVHALSKEGAEDLQKSRMADVIPDIGEVVS